MYKVLAACTGFIENRNTLMKFIYNIMEAISILKGDHKKVDLTVMNWSSEMTGKDMIPSENSLKIIKEAANQYNFEIEINQTSKYDFFMPFLEEHPHSYDLIIFSSCSNLEMLSHDREYEGIPDYIKKMKTYLNADTKLLIMWPHSRFIKVDNWIPSAFTGKKEYQEYIDSWNKEFELKEDLDFPYYVPRQHYSFKSRKTTSRKPSVSRKSRKTPSSRKLSVSRKSRKTASRKRSVSRKTPSSRKRSVSRKSTSRKLSVSRKSRKASSRKSTSRKSRSVSRKSRKASSRKRSVSRKSRKSRKASSRKIGKINTEPQMITLLVKSMTGDLLQIEVSNKDTVHTLKGMVLNANEENININQLKLINSVSEEELSDNNKTLESYGLENENILYMMINAREPPFMDQKYIVLKGHDIPRLQATKTEKRKSRLQNFENADPSKRGFQGSFEEFLDTAQLTRTQMKNVREFHEKVNLKYVYANREGRFIATNEDSSVVYFQNKDQADVYIRGYFIPLTTFRALTPQETQRMLVDDDLLIDMVVNWVKYSDRYYATKSRKTPKPQGMLTQHRAY
jgi:hypothetical protein